MKEKKNLPIRLAVGILVGFFLIGLFGIITEGDFEINSNLQKDNTSNSTINNTDNVSKEEDINSKYITLEEFNKIENGMSYEEVKNIIGSEGTVNSDTQVGDYKLVIYSWYGEDKVSNATFSFQNDVLTSKAQIGLK